MRDYCLAAITFVGLLLIMSCATSAGNLYKDTLAVDRSTPRESTADDLEEATEGAQEASEAAQDASEAAQDASEAAQDASEAAQTVPEKPEEEELQATGLEITSSPKEAEVYLDNRYMGTTPLLLADLPRGRYKLTITKKGYYTYNDWISYYEPYLSFQAELEVITGFLKVVSTPANAEISIGSINLKSGITANVPIGRYPATARSFGYEEYTGSVEIRENELTILAVKLKEADFSISYFQVNRSSFNPRNPGLLGIIRLSFQVSNYGSGVVVITDHRGKELDRIRLKPFTTWTQEFRWNGRGKSGNPLADGEYELRLEARDRKQQEELLVETIPVSIDSSLQINLRSLWSGSAGLLYAPSPERLPPGSVQMASLFIAHVQENLASFSIPWNLSLRLGLKPDLELDLVAGLKLNYDSQAEDSVPPFFAGAALKTGLFQWGNLLKLEVGAQVKATYQSVYSDTLANFTGLSVGLPLGLELGPVGLYLSVELIISPYMVSYEVPDSPGLYSWAYARAGLLLDLNSIVFGVSATFRSKPFHQGFSMDLPFQAGIEGHLLLPGTQIFLSLAVATEFSGIESFYWLVGAGLGLID